MLVGAAASHPIGMMRRQHSPEWDQTKNGPDDAASAMGDIVSDPTDETPVLDLIERMTVDSVATANLDPVDLMLVRIAALVAVDAPSVSYLMNLGAAGEVGVDAEQIQGVLAAIAPIVGTARIASATGRIVDALDVAIEVAEFEEESPGVT